MPMPQSFTHFTKRVNPVFRLFAGRIPGFGILHHVGRQSGTSYRIPVNVFLRNGEYIIGLTYGPDTDWAKNVMVAGECELMTRGAVLRLVEPAILTDESASWAPAFARPILRALKVHQYMRLREA